MVVGLLTCGHSKHIGSGIGSIQCTQEVIDLCHEHNIRPEIEIRPVSDLNEIYSMLDANNDKGIRYVLDIANTLKETGEGVVVEINDAPPPTIKEVEKKLTLCNVLGSCCALLCCCRWC